MTESVQWNSEIGSKEIFTIMGEKSPTKLLTYYLYILLDWVPDPPTIISEDELWSTFGISSLSGSVHGR